MTFPPKQPGSSKPAANQKLTVETIEPLVLLSASHFGFEFFHHDLPDAHNSHVDHSQFQNHFDQWSHAFKDAFNNKHNLQRGNDLDNALVGGSGHDQLHGQGGDDILLGRAGRDSISGGSGDDLIRAGSGDDLLSANEGSNILKGGSGNDTLLGGSQGSTLKGEAGNDVIVDGGGSDLVDGGVGDDLLIVHRSLSEYKIRDLANNDFEIESVDGTDVVTAVERIRFADGEHVVSELLQEISKATGVVTAPVPPNPITPDSVAGRSIQGSVNNDEIKGSIGDDLIKSGDGNDTVKGELGDDILKGGNGNDVLNGGEGDDRLLGGNGDDTLIVGNGNDFIDGGAGKDTAVFNTVFDVVDTGNGVIRVQSIEGTDTLTNVEQLSIDGTPVSIDQAVLFHGLPPADSSADQSTAPAAGDASPDPVDSTDTPVATDTAASTTSTTVTTSSGSSVSTSVSSTPASSTPASSTTATTATTAEIELVTGVSHTPKVKRAACK